MKWTRKLLILAVFLALASPAGAARYVHDGATQNAAGGWDIDKGECNLEPGATTRADCRSVIKSRGGAPVGGFDNEIDCEAAGYEWNNGPDCTNYWYNERGGGDGVCDTGTAGVCDLPVAGDCGTTIPGTCEASSPAGASTACISDADCSICSAGDVGTTGCTADVDCDIPPTNLCTDPPESVGNPCTTDIDCDPEKDVCENPAAHFDPDFVAAHGAAGVWDVDICRGTWVFSEVYTSSDETYREKCLRCHNDSYYADHLSRAVDTYVMTGHKNMLRPVLQTQPHENYTAGYPWAGSNGTVYGPEPGTFDWAAGLYNPGDGACDVGVTNLCTAPLESVGDPCTVDDDCDAYREMYWIYDGWIADSPRVIYDDGDGGMSYSCGRCHSTGWTSDATLQTSKEPETSFPGISYYSGNLTGKVNLAGGITGDPNELSSWDQWGIQCSRCHGSLDGHYCDDLSTPCTDDLDCVGILPSEQCNDMRHHPNLEGKAAVGSSATGATRVALCMDCHRQETGGFPYDSGVDPTVLKVGLSHGHLGFMSHWHGNLFLNSPHGRFSGTFAQINDKTLYDTHFKNEGESFPFQGNNGGCTQCHNVHKSTVEAANPAGGAIHEECTECHSKNLNVILHPPAEGTVFEDMFTEPNEACEQCHMPDGLHLFRINVDADYETIPAAPLTEPDCVAAGGSWNAGSGSCSYWNAGMEEHEGYANAVWVDLDHACGQCHGGGTNEIDNPPSHGAGYMTKVALETFATGIHNDKPYVNFTYYINPGDTVNVNAAASTCSGSSANCDVYDWNWGDGTANGSGVTASHSYATAGPKTITLTVREYGVSEASKTKYVTVYVSDAPPTVSGVFNFNADTWTATLTDTSTDDHGIGQVVVHWGDGNTSSFPSTPPDMYQHTYLTAGAYLITHRAIDTIGQESATVYTANANFFSISGTVSGVLGTPPLGYATLTFLKDGTSIVKTVYTASDGTFSAGSLRPGDYQIFIAKAGYTFDPEPVTIGPSQAGVAIEATGFSGLGSQPGRFLRKPGLGW